MSEDDPFDGLDPDEDREGDPFERLGSNSDPDTESPADEAMPAEEFDIDSPASDPGSGSMSGDSRSGEKSSDEPTAPADERDSFPSVDADTPRPEPAAESDADDPFSGGESVFERVDVGQIDADEVWAELAADDADDTASESRYAEVSKHRYCEQCEHFSAPPNAHCTNEGTEIMEFIDMETVRLLDCPIVAEQRDIDSEQ